MKRLIIILLVVSFSITFFVDVYAKSSHRVKSYIKKDGTYVSTHRRTNPDKSKFNNYSTKGNFNPYTGKKGSKNPYR